MKMRTPLLLLLIIAQVYGFAQITSGTNPMFTKADTDKVQINIRPTFNGNALVLGSPYLNAHGDTFYVDAFRFYITNISFTGTRKVLCTNAHLFDVEDTGTYSFIVNGIPGGNYQAMQFIIGVDSIANTTGANSGDLDPAKGMYWAWNSGYIMAKLEGHSKVCKTLHHAFEFHIGGYMPPYNAARQVMLVIPAHTKVWRLGVPVITLNADITAWLNDIDLSKTNNIVIPGKEAAMMADNYAKMFSVKSVSLIPLSPK